jgi:RNA polymerase sigma-70 factor (ECF subfamily)
MEFPVSTVRAAQAGQAEAISELLRLAWPSAYRIARSILRNATAAEDAAQEACARALDSLSTLRQAERFAPWLYRIVVNEARQRLRTAARELPLDDGLSNRAGLRRDELASYDSRIDVRRAIEALDPELRATIVLRYYFGMSSAEIGCVLETSPVTARWRLMIAHRKLRALLDPPMSSDVTVVQNPCR